MPLDGSSDTPPRPPRHLVNLIVTAAVQLLDAVVPVAMVLLIANKYGFDVLGNYCVATAFASIAAVLCGTGAANAVCFEIASAGDNKTRQNSILVAGVGVLAGYCVAAISIIVGLPIVLGYNAEMIQLVILLSCGYSLRAVGHLLNGVFRGRREMHMQLWPTLLVLGTVSLTVLPLLVLGRPLSQVVLTWSFCQAIGPLVLAFLLLRRGFFRSVSGARAHLRRIIKLSLTIGLESAVFRMGVQLVVVLLPLVLTAREIGIYNAAAKPFQLLVIANECVIQFFLPYLASVKHRERIVIETYLQRFHKLAFFFTATTIVLAQAFSLTISKILFGDMGTTVAPYMSVLALGYVLYYTPPYCGAFKSIGKERLSVVCATAQLITMMTSLVLLVPVLKIWGVVAGMCLAYTVYWLLEVWFYRQSKLAPVEGISRYLSYLACNVLIGHLLEATIGGLAAIVLFICCAAVTSLFLYWTPQERTFAYQLALPTTP